MDLHHLEGRKLCVVFATVDESAPNGGQIKMRTMNGRASVSRGGEVALQGEGGKFVLPATSYPNILPSDGTELLGDAEYFVILKVQGMDL